MRRLGTGSGFYDMQTRLTGREVANVPDLMLVEKIVEGLSIDSAGFCGGRDVAVVSRQQLGYVFHFKPCLGVLEFCRRPSRRV